MDRDIAKHFSRIYKHIWDVRDLFSKFDEKALREFDIIADTIKQVQDEVMSLLGTCEQELNERLDHTDCTYVTRDGVNWIRKSIKQLRDEIEALKAGKQETNGKPMSCRQDPHHCKFFESYWGCNLFGGKCLNFIDYLKG